MSTTAFWLAKIEEDVRNKETARIVEIVQAHADMDERGNRVLVNLIIDEIGGGSEVRPR